LDRRISSSAFFCGLVLVWEVLRKLKMDIFVHA
jgi:hypothetical protein